MVVDRLRALRLEFLEIVGVALTVPALSNSDEPRSHTDVRCLDLEADTCPPVLDGEARARLSDEGCTAVEIESVVPVDSGDTATTPSSGIPSRHQVVTTLRPGTRPGCSRSPRDRRPGHRAPWARAARSRSTR